jgi:hypothetical protein
LLSAVTALWSSGNFRVTRSRLTSVLVEAIAKFFLFRGVLVR